jgi:hypothetical protein
MSFADFTGRIVLEAFGKCKVTLAATATPGDLIAKDGTLADADSIAAAWVALVGGVSGDSVDCAMAAVLKKPDTVSGTDGDVTLADHGGTEGDAIYLSATAGGYYVSSGTVPQPVGFCMTQDKIFVCPAQYLTSTSLTLSGALVVGTTSTLTGNVAIGSNKVVVTATSGSTTWASGASLTVVSGNVTITAGNFLATAGNITSTLGNIVATEGDITATKGNVNVTAGNVIITAGYVKKVQCTALTTDKTLTEAYCGNVSVATGTSATITLTLPAASAGLEYTIYQLSGTKDIAIVRAGSDVIMNSAGTGTTLTGTAQIGNCVTLRCITAAKWTVCAAFPEAKWAIS